MVTGRFVATSESSLLVHCHQKGRMVAYEKSFRRQRD